jgi:hypothetical protein
MTAAPFIALALLLQLLALLYAATVTTAVGKFDARFSVVMSVGSAAGALIAIWIAGGLS